MHPGPLTNLAELQAQEGEPKVAWELLVGSTTSLPELAELVYGTYTPATAWAAWQLVADGLYFRGTPQEIVACLPNEVAEVQQAREAKLAEEQAWTAFVTRARAGQIKAEDSRYLREVEDLALDRQSKSHLLHELGRKQSPEDAHALLLELGYWDYAVDPYPTRLDLPTSPPTVPLSPLPEEPRTDLTHLPAFAIDDEGNQDPDDALSLDGNRLWVHVADVAALVRPNSPADQEAQSRGSSLYLPEKIIPMLPPEATAVLGLGLTDISPALSFGLDLEAGSGIVGLEIVPSWVRVQRLSYEQTESRLEEEPFESLYRLAQDHLARRLANGAIEVELPEVKVRVEGDQVVIKPLPPLKSRELVREAMLMVGAATASYALDHGIPCPFITQDPPETYEPAEGLAGMYARRRTLQRSQMKSVPAPHAGLGLDLYAQATSPLRRYSDLVVHQQLRAYLRGDDMLSPREVLKRVATADAVTGSIRQAERLARKHWTLVFLLRQANWQGEGVLVERRGPRSIVLIPDLDLETHLVLPKNLPLDSEIPLLLKEISLPELEAHFLFAPDAVRDI